MIRISKRKNKAIVTFSLDKECSEAFIKGSWNNWQEIPMKKKKNGGFYTRIGIDFGEWEFGYLCDGKWIIEEDLEKVESPFGSYNSILRIKK